MTVATYIQCSQCRQIDAASVWVTMSNGTRRCPTCRAISENEPWPTPDIQAQVDFINGYDRQATYYGQVTCVFACSMLELMLERLIWVVASEWFISPDAAHLIEIAVDAHPGRSRMIDLYGKLAHASLSADIKKLGYDTFMTNWQLLVEARNGAVHGDYEKAASIVPELVLPMVRQSLEVFSRLHNLYSAEGISYKTAMDSLEKRKRDLEKLQKWSGANAQQSSDDEAE